MFCSYSTIVAIYGVPCNKFLAVGSLPGSLALGSSRLCCVSVITACLLAPMAGQPRWFGLVGSFESSPISRPIYDAGFLQRDNGRWWIIPCGNFPTSWSVDQAPRSVPDGFSSG